MSVPLHVCYIFYIFSTIPCHHAAVFCTMSVCLHTMAGSPKETTVWRQCKVPNILKFLHVKFLCIVYRPCERSWAVKISAAQSLKASPGSSAQYRSALNSDFTQLCSPSAPKTEQKAALGFTLLLVQHYRHLLQNRNTIHVWLFGFLFKVVGKAHWAAVTSRR